MKKSKKRPAHSPLLIGAKQQRLINQWYSRQIEIMRALVFTPTK